MTLSDPGHKPSVEARRRAWGAIPTIIALAFIAAALALGWKFGEWTGAAFAAFVAFLGYWFLWRKGAPDNSGGQ